jgi:hypothetical protein
MAILPFINVSGLSRNGMKESGSQKSLSPSELIDARIKELGDWRGDMFLPRCASLRYQTCDYGRAPRCC